MKGVRERLVVELDAVASKLLRQHISGKSFMERTGDDPRAIASAAVCWLLGEDSGSEEVVEAAVVRNEAFYGKPVVQQHPPVAVEIDVEAARLLAQVCREQGLDARDVASGMLYSMLACELWDESYSSGECIQSAQSRRLSRAKRVKAKLPPVSKKAAEAATWQRGKGGCMSEEENLTMQERVAKGEFVAVTLYLTPAAHGLLVAMAASDGHGDVEECIQHELAGDVSSWMEGIGDTEEARGLFLRGDARHGKDAA